MPKIIDNLKDFKGNTSDQFDDFIVENSKRSVLKLLKDNDIAVDEVTVEELNELISDEAKNQREFAKGLAFGSAGLYLILGLLG